MNIRTVRQPDEIRSILSSPEWTVKQRGQNVPDGIRNSIAAEMYQSFARMTDGNRHKELRRITEESIAGLDAGAIPEQVNQAVSQLGGPTPGDLQYLVPGMAVAGLLDVPMNQRVLLVNLVRDFVIGSRENADAGEGEAAIAAIERILPIVRQWPSAGNDTDILASRIALFYQSSDAVAALVGNALLALGDLPEADPADIVDVSNTSRVPVRMTTRVNGDDRVVLDFEAAHGVDPESLWTFGYGVHRCPGSALAISIALEIIRCVQDEHAVDISRVVHHGWEPLPNVWIPVLAYTKGGQE